MADSGLSMQQPAVLWDDLDVAVVGGGPAGLAAAAAILRADPGLKIKVFESTPSYDSQPGAGVSVSYNGGRALEAIDPTILHRVAEAGVLYASMYGYNDRTGALLPPAGGLPTSPAMLAASKRADLEAGGYTPCMVQWYELRGALYGSLPPGVVEFGCKVLSCSEEPQEEQEHPPGGNVGSGITNTAAPFELQISYRSSRGAAAAAAATSSTSPGACGQGTAAASAGADAAAAVVAVARARHVIGADGYFSRVRRTAGDRSTPEFRRRLQWRGSITLDELQRAFAAGAAATATAAATVPEGQASAGEPASTAVGDGQLPRFLDPAVNPLALRSTHMFMSCGPNGERTAWPPERSGVFYAVGPGADGGGAVAVEGAGGGGGGRRFVWALSSPLSDLEAAGLPYPMPAEAEGEGGATSVQASGAAGSEALRRCLAATTHLPPDVRALLAATPPERVTEHGSYWHTQEGMRKGAWAQGRLVLLGDAAHTGPSDGQGANLALEDAAELGARVRRHGLGRKAFEEWEEARIPRVVGILCDPSPGMRGRMALVRSAAFEPLWTHGQLAAQGRLPPDVAVAAAAAEAAGGAEAAAKVVLEWSRGEVRRIQERKLDAVVKLLAEQEGQQQQAGQQQQQQQQVQEGQLPGTQPGASVKAATLW